MNTKLGGRPQKIDLEKIIQAALELGVGNLSMRKVADKLGVSSAALYRYVDSSETLLNACMDAFCKKIALPSSELSLEEYLIELGLAYRRALLSMPGISSYAIKFGPTTPTSFKMIDTVLGVMMRGGLDPIQAWSAFSLLGNFSFSMVQNQENFAALERKHGKGGFKIMRLQTEELKRTPHLASVLQNIAADPGFPNFTKRYEDQLQCLVTGIITRHSLK